MTDEHLTPSELVAPSARALAAMERHALACLGRGKRRDAEALASILMANPSTEARGMRLMGMLAERMRDWDGARQWFGRAVQSGAHDARSMLQAGRASARCEDATRAVMYLNLALRDEEAPEAVRLDAMRLLARLHEAPRDQSV